MNDAMCCKIDANLEDHSWESPWNSLQSQIFLSKLVELCNGAFFWVLRIKVRMSSVYISANYNDEGSCCSGWRRCKFRKWENVTAWLHQVERFVNLKNTREDRKFGPVFILFEWRSPILFHYCFIRNNEVELTWSECRHAFRQVPHIRARWVPTLHPHTQIYLRRGRDDPLQSSVQKDGGGTLPVTERFGLSCMQGDYLLWCCTTKWGGNWLIWDTYSSWTVRCDATVSRWKRSSIR